MSNFTLADTRIDFTPNEKAILIGAIIANPFVDTDHIQPSCKNLHTYPAALAYECLSGFLVRNSALMESMICVQLLDELKNAIVARPGSPHAGDVVILSENA